MSSVLSKLRMPNFHRARYLTRALWNKNKLDALRLIELRTLKRHSRLRYYNFPPSVVQIEITNRCNMRCKWCYRENLEMLGKVGDMPLEPLMKLIEGCRGVRLLHLFGEGEPLMYPGIIEVIRHAAKYVKCPSVTTNGTMLRHLGKELAESGLGELAVSIDGTDPETFREIRKVELSRILDNMSYFASISDIPIRINAVVSKDNLDSLRNMPELARSIGNVKELHFQGLHESEASKQHGFLKLSVENPDVKSFMDEVREKCRRLGLETNVDNLEYFLERPTPCMSPFAGIVYINKDGYLAPCCNYAHRSLANAFELGLQGALESQNAREFRKLMLDEDYPDHCQSWCSMVSKPQPGPSRGNMPGHAGQPGPTGAGAAGG
ncbi:MAG: radical SAM protein [Deltaproteobacteria bacterium]|nr:radical SAM protein [Deltaproteobacteria bacterium]